MNKSTKLQWLVGMAAGAAMLALATGCQSNRDNAIVHGEDFLPDESTRPLGDMISMEAANAARADGTLRSYHFDNGILNSLGEERIESMLRNGDANNPLVIYLDLVDEDTGAAHCHAAVTAFIKDHGLTDEQIQIKTGPNPNLNSYVAPLLAGQAAGPAAAPSGGSGASGASYGGAGAVSGGAAPAAH